MTNPNWPTQPVALLDAEGRVTALSAPAYQSDVQKRMTVRQAQMRCPDIRLYPLSETNCTHEQAVLASILAEWGLPVEEIGWGQAYVDLKPLTAQKGEVKLLSTELGRRIRGELGDLLQPALGWDSSKFTARAAARYTQPGRIRLVDKSEERHFLHNLSVQLLPLSPNALQQLNWMGIRTLGQYAELPANGVRQRFGKAGIQAQQWAKGKDNRPVRSDYRGYDYQITETVDMDPPSCQLDPVLNALLAALRPLLGKMSLRMDGLRRLQLAVTFSNGELAEIDQSWMDPIGCEETLSMALTQRLTQLEWPDQIMQIAITQVETSELPAHQMMLFPDFVEEPLLGASEALDDKNNQKNKNNRQISKQRQTENLRTRFAHLIERHGPIFWQPQLAQENHPIAERRTIYVGL